MKIAVLLKYFRGELGPFDAAALECALECGGEITVVTMAPPSAAPALEGLTRLGAKALLITDPLYAGSDTVATSYVLAEALKRLSPDAIFAGRQSVDGDTSQVPPMIAKRLGFDITTCVMEFSKDAVTTRSGESAALQKNTVYTFERIRALRFPSIFSKKGAVETWSNARLALDPEKCGSKGSPTKVVRSYESTVGRRECQFTDAAALAGLIREGLSEGSKQSIAETEYKADRIFYVGDIAEIAAAYAKEAVEYKAEGKSAEDAARELAETGASIVLFEATERYKRLAAEIAVLTDTGLCADCIDFRCEGDRFIMTRPAFGGNVTADIVCTSKMAFATVKSKKNANEALIFAVGKGALPHIEKIRARAKKYGASLASSRPLVDDDILPYRFQVGLTGKTVAPRVYVAFGISGAVQHTCAIAGAGRIIAINTDKNARIFDYSDYGILCDIQSIEL